MSWNIFGTPANDNPPPQGNRKAGQTRTYERPNGRNSIRVVRNGNESDAAFESRCNVARRNATRNA